MALEAIRPLEALFEIERDIKGCDAKDRRALRNRASRFSTTCTPGRCRARNPLALARGAEAYQLYAQALGRLRSLPP